MGTSNNLGFKDLIDSWEENLKQSQAFSPSDIQELKSHLLDQTDELIESGLDEKKAFLMASKLIGQPAILEDDYLITNQPYIQTRKTLLVTAGAILYYCFNYFTLLTAKLIVVFGVLLKVSYSDLLLLNKIILGIPLLFILFLFTSLLINDKYLIQTLNNIQIRPKQAVLLVILTFFFVAGDRCMLPFLNNSLTNHHWRNIFFNVYTLFEYIILVLILTGFIVVFIKYFRNSGGPD